MIRIDCRLCEQVLYRKKNQTFSANLQVTIEKHITNRILIFNGYIIHVHVCRVHNERHAFCRDENR